MNSKKWIKIPGPGQFRGEGNWYLCNTAESIGNYHDCLRTGYLPTHEGGEPPKADIKTEQKETRS